MRSLLFVVASFLVTIMAWGVYGPVLHWGQQEMSTTGGLARMRPFVCVGLAYFAIGVVVPAILLKAQGRSRRMDRQRHRLQSGWRRAGRDWSTRNHHGV